jgi:hypothetical protein
MHPGMGKGEDKCTLKVYKKGKAEKEAEEKA